jgi:hypothetical protein
MDVVYIRFFRCVFMDQIYTALCFPLGDEAAETVIRDAVRRRLYAVALSRGENTVTYYYGEGVPGLNHQSSFFLVPGEHREIAQLLVQTSRMVLVVLYNDYEDPPTVFDTPPIG